MHIAINGWFWNQPHVGSGQYLRNLLVALRHLHPEARVSLVVPDHLRVLDDLPPDVDLLPMKTRIGGHLGKVWFEQRAFPQAVARLGADIAHVPYWGPPLEIGVPLVCTVLDVIPLAIPQYRSGFRNRLYTSLVAAAARGAAHILTISEDGRQDIARRIHIPVERVTVTHLAVDGVFRPDSDPAAEQAARERYGLTDIDEFVLYLGSYPAHKNVKLLLAAYTYVAGSVDVPLVLAGHTPAQWGTERFPDLPAYIEELKLNDSVRWIGPIDEADKAALYRMAKVFAFPSRYEGFGLGPLEAMASGTPVVACDVSSIPEVTGDAAFLVEPDDSKRMGGAILSLLTDDKLAEDLRRRGLERSHLFSWRKTAEETWAVYQRLISDDTLS